MPRKRKKRSAAHTDEAWNWIEGQKSDSTGKLVWYPLYCTPKTDTYRTEELHNRIVTQHSLEPEKMRDGLGDFSKFRIRWAGELSSAVETFSEVRRPSGGYALSRPPCQVVNAKTGEMCVLPVDHQGKHSSKVSR